MVSVIVTTKNEAGHIASCVRSIRSQSYQDIEIIVVDNGSTDETKLIAKKLGARVFDAGPERSAQRNFGAGKAKGDYLLFLDADMILTPRVVEECVDLMRHEPMSMRQRNQELGTKNQKLCALVIPEQSFGIGFWARCKALERSYYVGLNWNTGARFFSKKIFLAMNGYDESNTGTEDFDLPQRIEEKFGDDAIGEISSFINHDEGELSLWATCKKKFYYAKNLVQYKNKAANQEKFGKQSSIIERYKLYFSKPSVLFKDPLVGIGMLFMKTCEFGAGGVGYAIGGISRKLKVESQK